MARRGLWQRWRYGERRLVHRQDWPRFAGSAFADWASRIMTTTVTDHYYVKQGRSTGRWVLRQGGEQLVVYLKRHRQAPLWQRLLAVFWPKGGWSAGFVEWRHLHWAIAHGVPVPAPVAVGEFIGPGLRLESFLAVEELTGMLPLHEAVPQAAGELEPTRFRAWKQAVSAQMAHQARVLHDHRQFHKDLYLCHFFVRPAVPEAVPPAVGTVHMIDLHRLAHHPVTSWRWRIKDLAELLFSSDVAGVNDRDRLRFLHQYLGARKLDRAGRRLLRLVLMKAGRYRKHNDKLLEDRGQESDPPQARTNSPPPNTHHPPRSRHQAPGHQTPGDRAA